MATTANLRPRPPRRGPSTVRPASFARPTHPRTAPPSRTAAPVRPRAPPIARPFTPMPHQSIDLARPTFSPGRGHGRRSANVTYASPAFREASQAARQARSMNDRLGRDTPSSSRRRVRLPSENSDSDDQPLAQRLRHRAPHPRQDLGPSTIPSPSPIATVAPPLPPIATPTPIPSPADAPLASPEVQVEPPLAQPSTSQQPQSTKVGPSHRPLSSTSPPEPSHMPPSTPSRSAAGPSGLAVGPSQPPPPIPLYYRTIAPSEVELQSRKDVPTSSLTMKGRLSTLWEKSMHQMELLPPPAQMDRFSELYIKACAKSLIINESFHAVHHQNKMLRDKVTELELQLNNPAQASHALRAEVKDLTRRKNHLEVSLAISNHELKGLKEEKRQVDTVHQQRMDQQALVHQRAVDQLTQKLRAAETLAQEQDKKLKSQAAQLTSQAAELLVARMNWLRPGLLQKEYLQPWPFIKKERMTAINRAALCTCVLQNFVHK
ncbi:protein PRRC2A-like [Zingiber officinale]|uniref:protein PRRC2A-like n=1 Tax=Zingiber officinale TaxID=94328 RepID=UPI001C4DC483|nr:protein PRRC2A-like [Zingiber officinale]